MVMNELTTYLGQTVRVDYTTKVGPQSRVGFVYTMSPRKLILLSFDPDKKHSHPTMNIEEEDYEIYCPLKSITKIKILKGAL